MIKLYRFYGLLISLSLFGSAAFGQDAQQLAAQVTSLGDGGGLGKDLFSGFSGAWLFAGVLFGLIGFAAFRYGKKTSQYRAMIIGVILMVYPYFFKNTIALYFIGSVLTILLFYPRKKSLG